MSKFVKRFYEWQNYVHYLLLSIGISYIAKYYGAPIDSKMFFIFFISSIVVDTIVHGIFWFAPKPIKWRD